MFDWLSKLFGRGSDQRSSPTQSSNSSAEADARARQEEERRKREEAARAKREAAEEAKKAKQLQVKQAEQVKQLQVKQADNSGELATPLKVKTATPRKISTPEFSQRELFDAMRNPNAPFSPELKAEATKFQDRMKAGEKQVEDTRRKRVTSAKANLAMNQLWAPVQSGARDIANLPAFVGGLLGKDEFSKNWSEGVDEHVGGIKIPGTSKRYRDFIEDTEKAKDLSMAQIYANGGTFSKPEAMFHAGLETVGSLVSPTEMVAGLRASTRLGSLADNVAEGVGDTIGATGRMGSHLTDATRRPGVVSELAGEAERAAADADRAISRLPTPEQIKQEATAAGRIDDGISSPSKTQETESILTQQIRQQQEEISTNYRNTLMGLDEIFQSLTPRPLAAQLVDGADPRLMQPQRADLDVPQQQPMPEIAPPEIPAPSKVPIAQSMDTPNTAASKAAADATPPVPPKVADNAASAPKKRTMEDMTDEEVLERFGKTREEILASREALKAEQAEKAQRKAAKEARKSAKQAEVDAAAEQAAIDAGEKSSKDIFAGKKRKEASSPAEKLSALRKRHEESNNYEERGLLARLIRAEEQGGGSPAKARRLEEARNAMAEFEANPTKPTARETGGKDILAGKKEADTKSKTVKNITTETENKIAKLQKRAESDVLEERVRANRVLKAYEDIGKNNGTPTKKQAAVIKKAEKDLAAYDKQQASTAPSKTAPATVKSVDTKALSKKVADMKAADKEQLLANAYDTPKMDRTAAQKKLIKEAEAKTTVEAPAKTKDIFAGKKRSEEVVPTKEAAPAKKATVIDEKGTTEQAAPSKTPIPEKVKTGERAVSQSKSVGGQKSKALYEKVSRDRTDDAAAEYAKNVPVKDYVDDYFKRDSTPVDDLIARAYIAQGRIDPGTPGWNQMKKIIQSSRTEVGQGMAVLKRFFREKASPREITLDYQTRYEKLDMEMSPEATQRIDALGAKYTEARDAAKAAHEQAVRTKSKDDIAKLAKAREEAHYADVNQKMAAYEEFLKDVKAQEKAGTPITDAQWTALNKYESEMGIFQYDAVDASILSATGTMINNAINGITVGAETGLFGKLTSRLTNALYGNRHGITVGGASTRGSKMGAKDGYDALKKEWHERRNLNSTNDAGALKRAYGQYKNLVTTGNELSEIPIRARIQGQMYDHYRQLNKKNGLEGDQLENQTVIDVMTDPLEIAPKYADEAYLSQGLSAIRTNPQAQKRLEGALAEKLEKGFSSLSSKKSLKSRQLAKWGAKAVVRTLVGFPSVVWHSGVVAGSKRVPVLGQVIDSARFTRAKTPEAKAQILNEGLQHLASGSAVVTAGYAMGASGMVTGPYPTDPNEQDMWDAQGKTEWSVMLPTIDPTTGDVVYDYYDLRKSLGAFALPLMITAKAGQNRADGADLLDGIVPGEDSYGNFNSGVLGALTDVSPVESSLSVINDFVDIMNGKGNVQNKVSNMLSKGRMAIPASSAINAFSKILTSMISGKELEARVDPDSDESFASRVMTETRNRYAIALPLLGEMLGLPAKQAMGIDIKAVSPLGKLMGAQKGANPEGEAMVQEMEDTAAKSAEGTRSVSQNTYDKVYETMDKDTQGLYRMVAQEGRTLSPKKQEKVDKAIAGIADGDKDFESKFSEVGDWESQAYVLGKKKEVLSADKATKTEKLEELDREIGRTKILSKLKGSAKENAKLYKYYKTVSQTQLKKMLDDEDEDNYNPDLAYKLVEMDEMFTENKLSWKTGVIDGWTKKKYDLDKILKSLSGRGGSGSGKSKMATNVSGLKVMESEGLSGLKYKTVSGMPNLMAATPRKNFKKTISIKKGVQL